MTINSYTRLLSFLGLRPKAKPVTIAIPNKQMLMPPAFSNIAGAYNDLVFSTIRLGSKWYGDLNIGETIDLIERDTGKLIARAVVQDLEEGVWEDIVHSSINNFATFGLTNKKAQAKLLTAVARAYGFKVRDIDLQNFTVVYLRLVKEA